MAGKVAVTLLRSLRRYRRPAREAGRDQETGPAVNCPLCLRLSLSSTTQERPVQDRRIFLCTQEHAFEITPTKVWAWVAQNGSWATVKGDLWEVPRTPPCCSKRQATVDSKAGCAYPVWHD